MDVITEQPEIEFLILADRVEAINGRLYMMGGGWDNLSVPDFGAPAAMSLAVGILIPWGQTNVEHRLSIWVEHEDGTTLTPRINGTVNSGRPPQAVPGQKFRSMIAINGGWLFPSVGTYRILARIGESSAKSYAFHVRTLQPAQPGP